MHVRVFTKSILVARQNVRYVSKKNSLDLDPKLDPEIRHTIGNEKSRLGAKWHIRHVYRKITIYVSNRVSVTACVSNLDTLCVFNHT